MASVIQWNCRGLKPRRNDLQLLLQDQNPCVIALQETKLKGKETILGFPRYKPYSKNYEGGLIACGGVALMVRRDLIQEEIEIKTPIQAVAVRVTLHGRPTSVVSMYLPPEARPIRRRHLNELLKQVPTPRLILGDFNAHNPIWGGRSRDPRGALIEQLLLDENLILFNNGKHTYEKPDGTGSSALDLCVGDPGLGIEYQWDVLPENYGSDHFPTTLTHLVHKNKGEPRPQHWIMKKANTDLFKQMCVESINEEVANSQQPVKEFTNALVDIASACIPKSSLYPKRRPVPWYDDECKEARKEKVKRASLYRANPTIENKIARNKQQAVCQRLFRRKKKESWENYVSKLDSSSTTCQVWNMIRKITGKGGSPPLKPLKLPNNVVLDTSPQIAAELARTIAYHSSSENLPPGFANVKQQAESEPIDFDRDSSGDELYNQDFTLSELKRALEPTKDTAPGPDDITNAILKLLPDETLLVLLSIANKHWREGTFPDEWREAIVIPIPKPDKDHSKPDSFRPISLTSCICKLIERMANNRLIWFLEKHKLLSDWQCGARKNRSTIDQLLRLDTYVREAFARQQHCVSVFFDIEKAYDTAWRYAVLRDLYDMGIRGSLLKFISNYLTGRSFRVRLGTTFSQSEALEEGFPQGGVLAVTLFLIRVNKMPDQAAREVLKSLFVDDLNTSYTGQHMHTIERRLQTSINRIHEWATRNGFKLSQSKTKCIHFCRKKGCPDPILTMAGSPIAVVPHHKFLGITFDRKLTYKTHIYDLKDRCMSALNILKVISHQTWGADRSTKLRLYRSLIRSKLDYGCFIYGLAGEKDLRRLSVVQNSALRLCLGAFCTSPIVSLEVEANEPPMDIRRKRLAMLYAIKVKANPTNPAYKCLFENNQINYDVDSLIPPLGIHIKPLLEQNAIGFNDIAPYKTPVAPANMLCIDNMNTELTKFNKDRTAPIQYLSSFKEIQRRCYQGFYELYTDGSKMEEKTGYAVFVPSEPNRCRSQRLPNNTSIFTAEAFALAHATEVIKRINNSNEFVIYTDSLSCVRALQHRKLDNQYIRHTANRLHILHQSGKTVSVCWIPGHAGIVGNEKADCAAKASLEDDHENAIRIFQPHTDSRQYIKQYVQRIWKIAWDQVDNDLHRVHPILPYVYEASLSRHEERVLARLHIGHTRLTHAYRLEKTDPSLCPTCNNTIAVKHILVDCREYSATRNYYYRANCVADVFSSVAAIHICRFIDRIGLFNCI